MSTGNTVDLPGALGAFERHRRLFNARARPEWLDNFVEVPFLEEPAHSVRRHGREHFGAILDAVVASGSRAQIEPPELAVLNGNELALHLRVSNGHPLNQTDIHIIEIFTISDCGRIAGIRAFVTDDALPSNLTNR
jgi:hypothetical protein